jgi:hypothetical protein
MTKVFFVERFVRGSFPESYKDGYSNRSTAESVCVALNTGQANHDKLFAHESWQVVERNVDETKTVYVSELSCQITRTPYSSTYGFNPDIMTVNVVEDGTLLPEQIMLAPNEEWPYWNSRVYARTIPELKEKAQAVADELNQK